MSRPYSKLSRVILNSISGSASKTFHELYNTHGNGKNRKVLYNTLFQLKADELIIHGPSGYKITSSGQQLIHKFFPKRDGVWKIVVYDIAEGKRKMRWHLRSRLRELGFKKWQNSIWVSPYRLDPIIEKEFNQLAERYFIRLIKTTDINYDTDLKKLFPEDQAP